MRPPSSRRNSTATSGQRGASTQALSRFWHAPGLAFVSAAFCTALTAVFATTGDVHSHPMLFGVWLVACLLLAGASRSWAMLPRFALVLAVVLRVLCAMATPALSDDFFRYIHEGRASRLGLAVPYAVPPARITPPPDDGTTAQVNHKEVPAAYPPGTQWLLLATTTVGDAMGAPSVPLRLVLALCDVAVFGLLWRRRRAAPTAPFLYAFHPLVLLEVYASPHLDAVGMLAVLVAALHPRWAGLVVGLLVHVKPFALVLVAAQRRWRTAFVAACSVATAVALPHLVAGAPIGSGLLQYGTRWRASPLAFALLEQPLLPFFNARAAADRYAHLHVWNWGVWLEDRGTTLLGTRAPHDAIRILVDAGFCARLLAAAVLVGLTVIIRQKLRGHARRMLWLLAAFWCLTPTIHPWYGLWLVPLAALLSRGWWWFSALLPLLYVPLLVAAPTTHDLVWPRLCIVVVTALGLWRSRHDANGIHNSAAPVANSGQARHPHATEMCNTAMTASTTNDGA